ncbi:MAG: SDR family oxidoreductase [Pseudomonadota bacterium]
MLKRTMLITGASAGIGAATARLAARSGWDVGVGYRSDAQGAAEVVGSVERAGRRAVAIQADVADPDQVARMFATFEAELGRMSAFVNNAGVVMPQSRFEDISADRLRNLFSINQLGAFVGAQHAVRAMAKRHGGRGGAIVNVSSVASLKGGPGEYVDYAASKGAMDTMTVGLSREMLREGVRVNAVRPGVIDTDIHGKGGQFDRVERLGPELPMGRVGTAEEVADAILWLASDASSYLTGSFIDVAGGRQI